jgi:hypothetical protein
MGVCSPGNKDVWALGESIVLEISIAWNWMHESDQRLRMSISGSELWV